MTCSIDAKQHLASIAATRENDIIFIRVLGWPKWTLISLITLSFIPIVPLGTLNMMCD